jgi:FlaA1/EpsC-like NDP-sugar epimerase
VIQSPEQGRFMAVSAQAKIPSQLGRSAVVTGATGGLGYETALALAKAGAEVILTGRDDRKGQSAIEKIRREVSGARVSYEPLDWPTLRPSPISRSGCIPDSRWIF